MNCKNHPQLEALGTCVGCGTFFCGSCLCLIFNVLYLSYLDIDPCNNGCFSLGIYVLRFLHLDLYLLKVAYQSI